MSSVISSLTGSGSGRFNNSGFSCNTCINTENLQLPAVKKEPVLVAPEQQEKGLKFDHKCKISKVLIPFY